MMCRTRLICRLPARESRWRTWSPEDASMGAVPFQDAKWPPVRETNDRADLDQQSRGAGRADAVQVHQRGAAGGDQFLEFFVGLLGTLVDPLEVSNQLRGHPAPGLAGRVARPDGGQQRLGLGSGQALL